MTHICVGKLTIIGSDNGLSPDRRQAIIRTNAGLLLIGPLGTNFTEILIEILTFSFKKMRFKVSSAKWRLFCLGLNELKRPSNATSQPSIFRATHRAEVPDCHFKCLRYIYTIWLATPIGLDIHYHTAHSETLTRQQSLVKWVLMKLS